MSDAVSAIRQSISESHIREINDAKRDIRDLLRALEVAIPALEASALRSERSLSEGTISRDMVGYIRFVYSDIHAKHGGVQ